MPNIIVDHVRHRLSQLNYPQMQQSLSRFGDHPNRSKLRGIHFKIKSITAREFFKQFPEVKKQLWGSEFWSDGGYIGTVGDGVMSDIIRNYVETQGTPAEKEGYKQMNLLEFE